ncbi:MAG: tetratricopeptide repeat protein [Cyanobacteria bacterium SIG26]|nr:tetratricopeptide repeat protein [Cyanobacteria bacterium SIG26]MBQ7126782.1 tetratricopeptide repeat protein [bacterium]
MKKTFLFLTLILIGTPALCSSATTSTYIIDAEKNAFEHNNKGILHAEEKNYYGAIQEFKIAISLNPQTQATATYFNNLGKVYLTIGYPQLALDCFQNSLTQYNLNFEYYQNLVDCYEKLGETETQLTNYKNKVDNEDNPFDKIILGLLYEKIGNHRKAIMTLDDFAMSEPDLMITPAIKYHIQEIVDKIL